MLNQSFIAKTKQWLAAHPLDAALMLVVGAVGLASGIWIRHIIADDAMITFRVAENLAYGRGFVYNVGERVQVTTTPLYAMLLAAGTWGFGAAPQAALVLNIALAALNPVLAYDVGRRLAGWITGAAGALLLVFMPLLVIAFSMESYLYVFLILASVDAYLARRYRLTGLLVGLTAMLRGDAALLGASLLTYDFLATRRLRWPMIVPAIGLPSLWYLFATVYYGSPFPATLQAKTAQGQLNWLGDYFISGFGEYWEDWVDDYSRLFYLFPALYLLGLIPALWRERPWLILIGRDVLYIAAFEGLGVTFAEWYYAPLMPGAALLTGRGIQLVAESLARLLPAAQSRWRQGLAGGAAAALTALLLAITLLPVTRDIVAANPDWKALAYPPAAQWVGVNTNPDAALATIDIGHLGYWSGRRIIDIVGLAQPDVAPHIAAGDFGYAIRHYEPEMVLLGATWLAEVQATDWFQQGYVPRHSLLLEGMDEPLVLFTRPDGVKVNTETVPRWQIEPLAVDFNRQIRLNGVYVKQPATPGERLPVTLYWESMAPIEIDFTVFVQLVDDNERVVAQADGPPQRGFYRTPFWQPGERIEDPHSLPLPNDLPPGQYDLLIGFYEAANGARLQILDEAGQFAGDHVRLPDIEVQPAPPPVAVSQPSN